MAEALPGEHLAAVLGDKDRHFPLGGEGAVIGVDCPPIVLITENFIASHVDHRLDRKDHAGHHEHFRAGLGYIADPWFFVEGKADAVSADLFNDGLAVFPGVGVDGPGDVAQVSPGFGGLQAKLYTFLGYLHQLFGPVGNISDRKHTGGV